MIDQSILKRIHELEIYTKRLLTNAQAGEYRAKVKGTGYEFDQIREYQPGDDIRFIDWACTARTGKVMARQYFEERSRTVMLFVDGSASGLFGTKGESKYTTCATVAAVLALAAHATKDAVGLVLFTDDIVTVVQPGRSRLAVYRLIEQLFNYTPRGTTSIRRAGEYLSMLKKKNIVAFIISDFIDTGFEKQLMAVGSKHDVIAVRCLDPLEKGLPVQGFIQLEDIETGEELLVDMRPTKQRDRFYSLVTTELIQLAKKAHIDHIDISPKKPFIPELVRFFQRRILCK